MHQQQKPQILRKVKISKMFKRIEMAVVKFMQYLVKLYEQYNIKYYIDSYYSTLIRIFSPFELLNEYKIDQNSLYTPRTCHDQTASFSFNLKNHSQQVSQIYDLPEYEKINVYASPQDVQQVVRPPITNSRKGRPRILVEDMELQLCQWAKSQVSRGRPITRFKIANKAKQIANCQEFQASEGWIDRFLKRYPEVKDLIGIKKPPLLPSKNIQKRDIYSIRQHMNSKKQEKSYRDTKKQRQRKLLKYQDNSIEQFDNQYENQEQFEKSIVFQQIISEEKKENNLPDSQKYFIQENSSQHQVNNEQQQQQKDKSSQDEQQSINQMKSNSQSNRSDENKNKKINQKLNKKKIRQL